MPLIITDRHSHDDISLWDDLEATDRVTSISANKLEFTRQALDTFLNGNKCYAGVSWGKDSILIAHLLWKTARYIPLVHLRPTNHNPDCDLVRDAYFANFPGQPYFEQAVDYTKINRRQIVCSDLDHKTDNMWYAAIRTVECTYGKRRILGIRKDESAGRRIRMFKWGLNSKNACAPIGWWTTADVFAYLAQNQLPVHPVYAMLGGGRWLREHLRVAEIGDTHGTGMGRREWEKEYYGDILRKVELGISYDLKQSPAL